MTDTMGRWHSRVHQRFRVREGFRWQATKTSGDDTLSLQGSIQSAEKNVDVALGHARAHVTLTYIHVIINENYVIFVFGRVTRNLMGFWVALSRSALRTVDPNTPTTPFVFTPQFAVHRPQPPASNCVPR